MTESYTGWVPDWSTEPPADGDLMLVLSGQSVLKPEHGWLVPVSLLLGKLDLSHAVFLGYLNEQRVYVIGVDNPEVSGLDPVSLREALLVREKAPTDLLSTGFQVWQWWRDHRYCGRCGEETGFHPRERAKWCGHCGIPWYPRLAPCVIVVIRRDSRYLLAKSTRAKGNFYSLIAGFVEPGESLEGAVAREVREETGLDVTNIRYHGSQHWPFPHQLMVGFFADYLGGELVLQEDEIEHADWFLPGQTPPVPPATTIAGTLIQAMERELSGGDGSEGL
ncbi:MAG: NAD(+) diphosphatase [Gammaproteobacteria bacterium]|nr:MAG: NAD(+) diphosphatase [Gammaproteobacteria bacterium]